MARLALLRAIGSWSLTRLQQPLVKTAFRLLKHAATIWLMTCCDGCSAPCWGR